VTGKNQQLQGDEEQKQQQQGDGEQKQNIWAMKKELEQKSDRVHKQSRRTSIRRVVEK
jgi:hypothetical protein